MKLSVVATMAMAGILAACNKPPEALESPSKKPDEKCMTIAAGAPHNSAGGTTCWKKTPSP